MHAHDRYEIMQWLRMQSLIYYNNKLDVVMTHAGIPSFWNLNEAIVFASEFESIIRGNEAGYYLYNMLLIPVNPLRLIFVQRLC